MFISVDTLDKDSFLLLIFLKLFKTDFQSYFYFDNSELIKKIFKQRFSVRTVDCIRCSHFPNISPHVQDLVKYYLLNNYSFSLNFSKEFYKVYILMSFMNRIYKNIFLIDFNNLIECYSNNTKEDFLKFVYEGDTLQFSDTETLPKTYENFKSYYSKLTGETYNGFS